MCLLYTDLVQAFFVTKNLYFINNMWKIENVLQQYVKGYMPFMTYKLVPKHVHSLRNILSSK